MQSTKTQGNCVDTQAQAPAHPHRTPVLALRYHGAAPAPHSPCHDPTPDQMFEIACEQKAREAQETAAVNSEKRADASVLGKIGGVIASAASAVGNAVHAVQGGGDRALRDRDHKAGEERFALNFPDLVAAGDRFIVQYACSVMNKGQRETGHILLSDRHICFVNATIKDAHPLDTIVSIQPSIAAKTFHEGMLYFMPIPKNYVMPDSIQLFLSDHKVLQLLDFDTLADKAVQVMPGVCKCRSIDMFYNWADHAWRKAVRVPVEGVQYTHHGAVQQHDEQHAAHMQFREQQLGAKQQLGTQQPQTQKLGVQQAPQQPLVPQKQQPLPQMTQPQQKDVAKTEVVKTEAKLEVKRDVQADATKQQPQRDVQTR